MISISPPPLHKDSGSNMVKSWEMQEDWITKSSYGNSYFQVKFHHYFQQMCLKIPYRHIICTFLVNIMLKRFRAAVGRGESISEHNTVLSTGIIWKAWQVHVDTQVERTSLSTLLISPRKAGWGQKSMQMQSRQKLKIPSGFHCSCFPLIDDEFWYDPGWEARR